MLAGSVFQWGRVHLLSNLLLGLGAALLLGHFSYRNWTIITGATYRDYKQSDTMCLIGEKGHDHAVLRLSSLVTVF